MSINWKNILKSEQGFSPVIIMGLLLFLSVAIVAGSYYVRNFTNILKSEAEEIPVVVNQQNLKSLKEEVASKSAAPTPPPIQNTNTSEYIIFYNPDSITKGISGMKKLNLGTEKEEPYLKAIEDKNSVAILSLPSPSLRKSIVAAIEKSRIKADEAPKINEIDFYLCQDIDCNDPQLLDKSTIAANLAYKNYWFISNWVNNSETKLILTAYPRDPIESPLQRTEIAVLDLQTMEVKTLLSDFFTTSSELFLDTTLDIMIAINAKSSGEQFVSTYNLIDNKRTDYPVGKIKNFHYYDYGSSAGVGPFYLQAKENEPAENIQNLEVYSVLGNLIATIPMPEENGNWKFNPNVSWSHTNNHFLVMVESAEDPNLPKKMYVFDKEGITIGSFDLSLSTNEFVKGTIFSPDDKKILIASIGQNSTNWRWQIFPVSLDAKLQREINSDKLGVPVMWN